MTRLFLSLVPLFCILARSEAIYCFKCDTRFTNNCLDPFSQRPQVLVNCDDEPIGRGVKPVFCEKTSELVGGILKTSRGCSSRQVTDLGLNNLLDRNGQQNLQCLNQGSIEQCLCSTDQCNPATRLNQPIWMLLCSLMLLAAFATSHFVI